MVISRENWMDAQYSVLGSALIDAKTVPLIISGTDEEDYTGPCLAVFKVIKSLFTSGLPIDPVIVRDRLDKSYTGFLTQLMELTPTAANVRHYIELCRNSRRLLALREVGSELQEAETLRAAEEIVQQANKVMVERSAVRIVTMEEAMSSFFARHEGRKEYLTWPIDGLNDKLYAEPGDFIILGGYPSDGKSAMAIQMAYHMAQKKRVGFFSLETNENKLFDRMMAHVARIPFDAIKTNTLTSAHWEAAAKASSEIIGKNLHYIPAAGMSVSDIQAVSHANRYDVIFVDYLQLISGKGKDRFSVVTDISIGLHTMAQSTGITVIALAQLSRPEKSKSKDTPPPELSSLRESGQIEQDADIVFMVYRPRPDSDDRMLLIRKNKEGKLGSIALSFDGQYQTFSRKQSDKYAQLQRDIRSAGRQFERLPDNTPVPFEEDPQCKLATM